jgi:hypothetical protein
MLDGCSPFCYLLHSSIHHYINLSSGMQLDCLQSAERL